MKSKTVLVVDDAENLLILMKTRLKSLGYQVTTVLTAEDAKQAMLANGFDVAIVDLQLINQDGISLMEELHLINPDMPVIILTAYGSIETAVEAMKKGAYTYFAKPFDPRELAWHLEKAIENRRLISEVKRLKGLVQETYGFSNIVARSKKMQIVLAQVSRIARNDSNVYLYGESGTGKELIARAIHVASGRQGNPFVAINCAALPENLLESELFGHEKGAFTGAIRSSKGLFFQANGGTAFLDEIGDMPLSIQAKLLRVLQDRQFYPLGSQNPLKVDLRVIVATNKNLEEEVKRGNFREDLFYRIHVIPIELPPLRERKEDIRILIEHFLRRFNEKMGKRVKGLVPMAIQRLMLYDWPGNVRELENTIEYAVAMTQDDVIKEDLILNTKASVEPLKPLKEARESFEREYLSNVLKLTEGNISKAAELTGKYRADFYNLLKKYGLKPERRS